MASDIVTDNCGGLVLERPSEEVNALLWYSACSSTITDSSASTNQELQMTRMSAVSFFNANSITRDTEIEGSKEKVI